MLSIEDPPPDPLIISQLKSGDDDDDEKIKASSDLFKSGLLDDDNKNPLPNFSIRDYVFSTRSKDITASWPFSKKNLQLCLKLGFKELLPPFQSFDSLRNQFKRSVVDDSLLDQENLSNTNAKPSRQSGEGVLVPSGGDKCNKQLSLEHVHIISGRSDKEEEFPSTEEESLPLLDSGVETLLVSSGKDVEAAVIPETRKTRATIQPPVKKCRLIVKLSNIAGSSGKDQDNNMHNSFMVSETTMASKVCPVCKTFSSSSNTTLNAHIDQCLSGESTVKLTADPKVIKHRIKPRKTRLMVDIYATAKYCTLEDLDRRNGTSWAVTSTLPAQETEVCVEERVQRVSTVASEETSSREGAVYLDTDGTKVRILSKLSNASESKVEEHARPKLLKGSKFLTAKKKQPFVKKHKKFLKLAPRGDSCSPKSRPNFETRGGPERNFSMEHNRAKDICSGQHVNAQKQVNLDESGITRKWVCSKNNDQDDSHHQSRSDKDLPSGSDQPSLRPKNPRSCNNSSSPQSSKKMKSIPYDQPGNGLCREQPNVRKGGEFSLLGAQGDDFRKRPMISSKLKKLREEGISSHDNCKSNSNYAETCALSLGNNAVEINAARTKMSDVSFVSPKPPGHHQTISSEATKFSSRMEKLPSKCQAVILKSKYGFPRKRSSPTRSQVHSRLEFNNEFAARPSHVDDDQQYDSMQDYNDKQSEMEEFNNNLSRSSSRGSRIRNNRGAIDFSRKEETAACLTSSLSKPLSYGHGINENMEFSSVKFGCSSEDTSDDEDSASGEVFARRELAASKSSSKTNGGRNFVGSSSSSDQEYNDLDSPPAQRCTESINHGHLYEPEFPNDRSMGDNKKKLFSSDEDEHVVIGEDTCIGTELDLKDVQAHYFSEVDPIPIPGPPGSFLPSPGHMESEDLQGNSSLTTCRVQSMDDQHDLVDRALSDSPISAISGISNPIFARSNSRSSEKFFVAPHAVQDYAAVENFVPVSQATNFGTEQLNLGAVRVDKIFPEKASPLSSKAEQSCCCSRKEGASLGVALDFQESQLLRRQTIALLVPLPGKQMDSDSSKRINNNLPSRSEMFPATNFPSSGPEKVVHHSMKLATGNIPMKVSTDPEVKFPIRTDHDSASPSASNPVLRLMGKNLMVVNKDEDESMQQIRQQQQQANLTNGHPNPQSCIVNSGFSHVRKVRNEEYTNFHQAVPQSPVVFSHEPNNVAVGQHFDVRLLNNFRSNVGFKTPKSPFHAPGVMFPTINASMEQYGNKGKIDHLEANVATSRPHKEIIIIDDASENDSESVIDARCNMGMRRNLVSPSNSTFPRNFEYNAGLLNPFYSNQLDGGGGSMYGVRPMMNNAAFQMSSIGGANASPVKWSCNISDGSTMRLQSSLGATTPASSPGHVRPTFYYSPSFS